MVGLRHNNARMGFRRTPENEALHQGDGYQNRISVNWSLAQVKIVEELHMILNGIEERASPVAKAANL